MRECKLSTEMPGMYFWVNVILYFVTPQVCNLRCQLSLRGTTKQKESLFRLSGWTIFGHCTRTDRHGWICYHSYFAFRISRVQISACRPAIKTYDD
jgi:hypothetical protein